MKTPEQWAHEEDGWYSNFANVALRIQQDAMAHQRTLDAAVCDKFHGMDAATCNSIKAEILKDL